MSIELRPSALRPPSWFLLGIAVSCFASCDSSSPRRAADADRGLPSFATPAVSSGLEASIDDDRVGVDAVPVVKAHTPSANDSTPDALRLEVESEFRFDAMQSAIDDSPPAEPTVIDATEGDIEPPDPRDSSHANLSLRNADFPQTYIESIHVELASPHHWVRLKWSGPEAERQEVGPFRSSPGAGLGRNNCDDVEESQRNGSNCTPKGENIVEGFSDYLPSVPRCEFVTWFNLARQIAFHSHWQVPHRPASHGCVRLNMHAAQLIHNNSRIGKTRVLVDGTWSRQ